MSYIGTNPEIPKVRLGNGSASSPSFSFSNATNSGMYRTAGSGLGWSIAGTTVFTIDTSGNFTSGISGTSTSHIFSVHPVSRIDVQPSANTGQASYSFKLADGTNKGGFGISYANDQFITGLTANGVGVRTLGGLLGFSTDTSANTLSGSVTSSTASPVWTFGSNHSSSTGDLMVDVAALRGFQNNNTASSGYALVGYANGNTTNGGGTRKVLGDIFIAQTATNTLGGHIAFETSSDGSTVVEGGRVDKTQRWTLGRSSSFSGNIIYGVSDGTASTAGAIGETILSTFSATNYTTSATTVNAASISLTPGKWAITAAVNIARAGATFTSTSIAYGISATSATFTGTVGVDYVEFTGDVPTTFTRTQLNVGDVIINISSSSTYYAIIYIDTFTAGNPQISGHITAKRIG